MVSVLFVTIGGSHQPILTAIACLKPDRVVFCCSKDTQQLVVGEGTPCQEGRGPEARRLPNIPTQLGLGAVDRDRGLLIFEDVDDLGRCYRQLGAAMRSVRVETPAAELRADYTGGTKTMSAALVLAALDFGAELYVTTAERTNMVRVERGQVTEKLAVGQLQVERTLDLELPPLWQNYHYPAIVSTVGPLLTRHSLTGALRDRVRRLHGLAQGLDAWDRFDHGEALSLLERFLGEEALRPLVLFLKRSIASRAKLDGSLVADGGTAGHGYEVIQDLVLNASRRAAQSRYDDAVGRLYRALELLAQLRLQLAHGVATGDVDLARLAPLAADLQAKYARELAESRSGKLQLALTRAYVLLGEFPQDPLGKLYHQRQSGIQEALKQRNYSLFAHGFTPIDHSHYEAFSATIGGFIEAAIIALVPANKRQPAPQFPTVLP